MAKLTIDSVLLGLLAAESCHGYQLLEHFRDPARLGRIWNLSTSQLYTTLKRLERRELIDGREEASADAPIRTVYWVTDHGRHIFLNWLEEPFPSASTRHIRTEFLSRLYVARLLKRPTEPIIEAQVESCEQYVEELTEERDSLPPGAGRLALDLRIAEQELVLKWLVACEGAF